MKTKLRLAHIPEPDEAELAARARSKALREIIRPLAEARYEVDCHFQGIEGLLVNFGKDYGGVELEPEFQRGHVWESEQQSHFIENILRGVVSTSGLVIQLNCPNFDGLKKRLPHWDLPDGIQCIDGLQRLTAVRKFMAGEVRAFGMVKGDFAGTEFDMTRMTFRLRFAIYSFERKVDLLNHYLALNAGGTPHSQSEIARVTAMRDELLAA
jgi:hypothetical protein